MKMRKGLLITFFLFLLAFGCDEPAPIKLPPTTIGGGWILLTGQATIPNNPASVIPVPGITIQGDWQKDFIVEGPLGDPTSFTVISDPPGFKVLFNRRIRAQWKLTWIGGGNPNLPQCPGQFANFDVHNQWDRIPIGCISIIVQTAAGLTVNSFQVIPNPVYTDLPPTTVMVTGQGFNCTYGMPLVQYFDVNGNVSSVMNASNCAADGTWISAPAPPFTGLSSGTYIGIVSNANASGGYDFLATVLMTVVAPIPPPPPPPPDPGCGGNVCLDQP